ncbi:MAG: hypothetical protein N4A38_02575 [Candidatus Gracilibacteria bacterium]|nr:hypothetical protein [Candidatus Gracilibacteria bacterium]
MEKETIIGPNLQARILNSKVLSQGEKTKFLRFISYMSKQEKEELLLII